jgi:hypothetical protein
MNKSHTATPILLCALLLVARTYAEDPHGNAAQPAQVIAPAALLAGHPSLSSTGDMHGANQIAGAVIPTAEGGDLLWTVPTTWEAKPGASIRKGSYRITVDKVEADLAITAFPGTTGGLEANLNRWRSQVGLAALPAADVVSAVEKFSANNLEFTMVDYRGSTAQMLGAIVSYKDNSWFFKLMGPAAVVTASKAEFIKFLRTVKAP